MRPGEGTHLYFLDNEGVLFHEPAQKLYHLNTVTAFIWCQIEDGKDERTAQRELAQTFSVSPDEARRYLAQAQELLEGLGVLEGVEPPVFQGAWQPPAHAADRADAGPVAAERRYRLLSSLILVRYARLEQFERVDPILAHLAEPMPEEAVSATLDLAIDDTGRHGVWRDGVLAVGAVELAGLAPLVKGLVWHIAVAQHEFFLDIHAGVVGDGRCCYLLPAAPGSGKSTLTAALVRRGFEYFSDEVALLRRDSLHVEPVPLAICVKHTGVDALGADYPHLQGLDLHLRGDGKQVRYLPPPRGTIPPRGTARPVGAIVFPHYRPDGPTRLERMGKLAALESLMRECLIVDTRLDPANVTALLGWLESTPCYNLAVADLDRAVASMRTLSSTLTKT